MLMQTYVWGGGGGGVLFFKSKFFFFGGGGGGGGILFEKYILFLCACHFSSRNSHSYPVAFRIVG